MIPDIDIDLADRRQLLDLIQAVPARQENHGTVQIHNSGIYVTAIPWDPVLAGAAIDYREAEQRGYFKIDLLNVGVYQLVRDPQHYEAMLNREPPWTRLWQDPDWASTLIHVGGYTNLLARLRPDSIPRMAAVISVIRPGKAHLQHSTWTEIFESVWDGDHSRGFTFKKSHAISYARLVVLHMNLLDTA
jgi:hypothetical protein